MRFHFLEASQPSQTARPAGTSAQTHESLGVVPFQTIPADITNSLPFWNVLKTALCTTIVNRLHSMSWDGSTWSIQGRNNPLGDWFKKECFKSRQHRGLCLALNSIQDSIVLFNGLSGHFTAIPSGESLWVWTPLLEC